MKTSTDRAGHWPGLFCALYLCLLSGSVGFANTSPADIQQATDATFGPWITRHEDPPPSVQAYENVWSRQNVVTLDGVDAAYAFRDGTNLGVWGSPYLDEIRLESTISGPATLYFSYLTSSWNESGKPVSVSVDGVLQKALPNRERWQEGSVTIPAGSHVVRWGFEIYARHHALDQVWTEDDPRPRILGVAEYNWREGVPVTVALTVNKPSTFSAQGLPPGIVIHSATGELAGSPSAFGSYLSRITADNGAGQHTKEYLIRVAPPLPPLPAEEVTIGVALDTPALDWNQVLRTGLIPILGVPHGPAQSTWFGVTSDLSWDGIDAAAVALDTFTAITAPYDGAYSAVLRTVVEGPGIFSIWHRLVQPDPLPSLTTAPTGVFLDHWRNGSYGGDGNRFLVPGTPTITETWTERKFSLPTGRHTLEFAVTAVAADWAPFETAMVLLDQASFHAQPVPMTFRQWMAAVAPESTLLHPVPTEVLLEDTEGDGLGLLLEYALGGSPQFDDADLLPKASVIDGHLTLTVRKAPGSSGLEYTVQANPSLSSNGWTTFGTEVMFEDGNVLVVRCKAPMSEQPACHLRARVRLDTAG